MNKLTINDLDLRGKRVFIRVDFNVPLKDSVVTDDTRVRETLPTLRLAIQKGGRLVLASHLGRPKGGPDPKYSLAPVAKKLQELLERDVVFANDCVGGDAEAKSKALGEGGVLLMEKELAYLGKAVTNPARPFVAILGGAKVSDKIEVVENLMKIADAMLIGGGMAYTFEKAQGFPIGKSLVENDKIDLAKRLLADAKAKNFKFLLPKDHVVAPEFKPDAKASVCDVSATPDDQMGLDIGPKTIAAYTAEIAKAKTIVWNGPMGVFEMPAFAKGTLELAKAVAAAGATSIV